MEKSWRLLGASVLGTSHQKRRTPCQDAHAYRLLPDGTALLAAADGAGSAARSDEGAALAVAATIEGLAAGLAACHPCDETDWQALIANAVGQARLAVLQLAQKDQVSPRLLATTLTCALVNDAWLTIGHIGDGAAVAQDRDGSLFTATEPQRGEYANETFFLTADNALDQLQLYAYQVEVQALIIMTDGTTRLALNLKTNQPHTPFFDPLLRFVTRAADAHTAESQLAAFLASDRVCARTDDDKTLVLGMRLATPLPDASQAHSTASNYSATNPDQGA